MIIFFIWTLVLLNNFLKCNIDCKPYSIHYVDHGVWHMENVGHEVHDNQYDDIDHMNSRIKNPNNGGRIIKNLFKLSRNRHSKSNGIQSRKVQVGVAKVNGTHLEINDIENEKISNGNSSLEPELLQMKSHKHHHHQHHKKNVPNSKSVVAPNGTLIHNVSLNESIIVIMRSTTSSTTIPNTTTTMTTTMTTTESLEKSTRKKVTKGEERENVTYHSVDAYTTKYGGPVKLPMITTDSLIAYKDIKRTINEDGNDGGFTFVTSSVRTIRFERRTMESRMKFETTTPCSCSESSTVDMNLVDLKARMVRREEDLEKKELKEGSEGSKGLLDYIWGALKWVYCEFVAIIGETKIPAGNITREITTRPTMVEVEARNKLYQTAIANKVGDEDDTPDEKELLAVFNDDDD